MSVAVANRPVEQFETQVPMPDWQLSPEEEMYGDQAIDANDAQAMMVDENGMPLGFPPPDQGGPQPVVRPDGTGDPSQQELDQAFPPQQQQQRQPQRQPQPQPQQSTPPPDPLQPRPDGA
jgi:penicillin-binding protein 1A